MHEIISMKEILHLECISNHLFSELLMTKVSETFVKRKTELFIRDFGIFVAFSRSCNKILDKKSVGEFIVEILGLISVLFLCI